MLGKDHHPGAVTRLIKGTGPTKPADRASNRGVPNTNDPLASWKCRAMMDGPASVAAGTITGSHEHNYRQSMGP